jgi:hypothetical protein
VVQEPWRVMTLLWQAIRAALLPISLRDIPRLLEGFLEHLGRRSDGTRERRAAVFYCHVQAICG